jgi:5-methylcytosine-specific restriction endonuclease McrA
MNAQTFTLGWRDEMASLSDAGLLEQTMKCASSEREQTAALVAHLSEIYRRDLALKRGYPSLFRYAREALGLTDMMAWERVAAARLALRVPETVERLSRGELTLDAAGELWKCLQEEKKVARGSSTLDQPKSNSASIPTQPSLISDPVPQTRPVAAPSATEIREAFTKVLGKTRRESAAVLQEWRRERTGSRQEVGDPPLPRPKCRRASHSKIWTECAFFLNADELTLLDRLRDLLSHKLGTRDPHVVLQWLLRNGLDRVDPVRREERIQKKKSREETVASSVTATRIAAPQRSEKETVRKDATSIPSGRSSLRSPISAPLKRRIWIRDQGRCQHTDPQTGRRCEATAYLDLDHITPVSQGGENQEENLRLACANHNRRRFHWEDRDQPVSG